MSKIFNNKKTTIKNKSKYIVLAVLMLVSIFSVSYAVFTVQLKGEKKYSLTIGTLDFSIDNEQNSIRLMNAYPMSDTEGGALRPYTFTLTNTGTLKEYYKISLITDTESQATCTGCTFLSPSKLRYSLTVDGVVGEAKNVSDQTVLELGELAKGQSKNYELRLWLNSEATIEEENKYYYGKIKVDASQEIVKVSFTDELENKVQESTSTFPDFEAISSASNGRGIYKYTEDGKDIYYWRGNIDAVATEENGIGNHVIFGGYCWEMVRTTKTGGIKIIYDGLPVEVDGVKTCPNTGSNSQLASKSVFNSSRQDNVHVGYMYGLTRVTSEPSSPQCIKLNSAGTKAEVGIETSEAECVSNKGKWITIAYEKTHANIVNSGIKGVIDEWFRTSNLNTKENLENLEDSVYCNDRSIDPTSSGTGYGTSETDYGANYRLYDNKQPSLECANENDRFTTSKENGNGDLTYPVGLITADEMVLAGGVEDLDNTDFYLYTGESYWTISPDYYSTSYATGFTVAGTGELYSPGVNKTCGVRPVISLATGTTFASGGAGTINNPYVVE